MEKEEMYIEAMNYKALYNSGKCDRDTAKKHIMPYINFVNEKSKEIAKKYNIKSSKIINFASFVR